MIASVGIAKLAIIHQYKLYCIVISWRGDVKHGLGYGTNLPPTSNIDRRANILDLCREGREEVAILAYAGNVSATACFAGNVDGRGKLYSKLDNNIFLGS